MNLKEITWSHPIAHVAFTKEDLDLLILCSSVHYDSYCRSVSVPGRGAFLNGWRNSTSTQHRYVEATFRELDTCLKLLEMPFNSTDDGKSRSKLYFEIKRAMVDMDMFVQAEKERTGK